MNITKSCNLLVCIITCVACVGLANELSECGRDISESQPAEYHIEEYAKTINDIVPALQVIAHNGVTAPSVEVLHGYAQVILHGLEGSGGPHGDLVPLSKEIPDLGGEVPPPGSPRSDWIDYFGSEEALSEFEDSPSPKEELLAPLQEPLAVVKSANSVFREISYLRPSAQYIGLMTVQGGALCLMERMLPQLGTYAADIFPDNPGQQLYIEELGNQVLALLELATDCAVACIEETDYDLAVAHMLNVNAYLFTAMGNSFSHGERPVTGTGLFFLMHNLLGWTHFGF